MNAAYSGSCSSEASRAAEQLLRELDVLRSSSCHLDIEPSSATRDWAESGGMALTGAADGPPQLSPGAPASAVRGALAIIAAHVPTAKLPGSWVISERAALAGLTRHAPTSVGGTFRALPTADGWIGLSLPRKSDLDLLAAVIESPPLGERWAAVRAWLANQHSSVAQQRFQLLGMASAVINHTPPPSKRPGIRVCVGPRRSPVERTPLVVDLTSLWAGPLCANLLGLAGARVIKVESLDRPDGARGTRAFFDVLHAGHESVALDFNRDCERLDGLLRRADIVLESSRPRALEQVGINAMDYVDLGKIWISVTAYGREGDEASRVGFGDDVAAGAGLVTALKNVPYPVGDAIADPLAGVYSAAAATVSLSSHYGCLIDVSMHDVVRSAAMLEVDEPAAVIERIEQRWVIRLRDRSLRVSSPRARRPKGHAPSFGQHTNSVFQEFYV